MYDNRDDYKEKLAPRHVEETDSFDEDDDPIADILYEIVTRMGFQDIDIEWEERSDHTRYFVEGEGLGILIGRHGATLEALQYLVGVINSRQDLVEHKIIVDIEGAIVFGGRKVAEKELRQPIGFSIFPDLQDILHTGIDFAAGVIRQQRVHQPLVEANFPAIRGN